MDDLKSLINTINRNRIKQIEIIEINGRSNSKVQKLYNGIADNRWENDDEAAQELYGDNPRRHYYLKRLKRQLTDRLINTVFFVDVNQKGYTDIQRAYYTCIKNMAAANILIGKFAHNSGKTLMETTLKRAMEFGFTEISLFLVRKLIYMSANYGNKSSFKKYNLLSKKFREDYKNELLAEQYFSEIILEAGTTSSVWVKKKPIFEKYFQDLYRLKEECQTNEFIYFSYLFFVIKFEMSSDYESVLQYSNEAIKMLSVNSKFKVKKRIYLFVVKKVAAFMYLRRYEEAKDLIEENLRTEVTGSHNWYVTLIYLFRISILSKDFQEAYNTYLQILEYENLNKHPPLTSEIWKIQEAFIYYLIRIGKIQPSERLKKQFRVKKFLNEVPLYSKDKRGYNISILILHILFLLNGKQYEKARDRIEGLKLYEHRYLRKNESFRSSCFIKMLLQISNASFHKTAVLRKTKKLRQLLEENPIGGTRQSVELEIVPYEQLWEYILEDLDDKFH